MSLTIEIDDRLATLLEAAANSRDISVDKLACGLLDEALHELDDDSWMAMNRRRISLIRLSIERNLSIQESAELQALQDAADLRLDERDRELLDMMERFRRSVEQLPVKETRAS